MITLPRRQPIPSPLQDDSPSASSYKKELQKKEPRALTTTSSSRKQRRGSLDFGKWKTTRQQLSGSTCGDRPSSEPYLPTQQPINKPKAVSFARTAKVKKVRSRAHFTAQERDAMWYVPNDYIVFKKDALDTLRYLHSTATNTVSKDGVHTLHFTENDHHTLRGLESRTKEAAVRRKEFKAYARELVLEEQENQREDGRICWQRIRQAYLDPSMAAIRQAHMYARQDAHDVRDERLPEILGQIRRQYNSNKNINRRR